VRFRVDGLGAGQTATWELGGAEVVNLTTHGLPVIGPGDRARSVAWPSADTSFSLQDAIDAAPDGGRVEIGPGVWPVGPVFIRDKQITIAGSGSSARAEFKGEVVFGRPAEAATRLVGPPAKGTPADPRTGTYTFNFINAGGTVTGLDISGGDGAIVQRPGAAGAGQDVKLPLHVEDVGISNTGVGILALDTPGLFVDASLIQKVDDGIILVGCHENFNVSTTLFSELKNIGIYVQDCPSPGSCDPNLKPAQIVGNTIIDAKGGGIAILKSGLCIKNNSLLLNHGFGIGIFNSAAVIKRNFIFRTGVVLSGVSAGGLGDGVVVWSFGGPALAAVIDNIIFHSYRVGVSSFGGEVMMADNFLYDQSIDLGRIPWHEFEASFADGEGNICDSDGSGPGEAGACRTESPNIEPPPPVGGLE